MGTSTSKESPSSTSAGPTAKQRALRHALISGDLRVVQQLLVPGVSNQQRNWRCNHPFARKAIKVQEAARLDYLYEDDLGAPALAYLACGTLADHALLDGSLFSELWSNSTAAAARNGMARLEVLQWLVSPEQSHLWEQLSLDKVSHKLQTVFHCLLLNGGHIPMLQQLLAWWNQQAADGSPSSAAAAKLPSLVEVLSIQDHLGRTALDMALQTSKWQAVRLLTAAGACQDWSRLPAAVPLVTMSFQAPVVDTSQTARLPAVMEMLFPGGKRPASLVEAARQLPAALTTVVKLLSGFGSQPHKSNGLKAVDKQMSQATIAHGAEVSVQSLRESEVMSALQGAVQQVCGTLGVDEATALKMLSSHNYDVDLVLEQHAAPNTTLQLAAAADDEAAAALSHEQAGVAPASKNQNQRQQYKCEVCWELLPAAQFSVQLSCGHHTCDDCWKGLLQARIDEGDPWRTCCPHASCGLLLPSRHALQLLPPGQQKQLLQSLTSHYVTQHPRSTWCPRPGCGHSVHLSSVPRTQQTAANSKSSGGDNGEPSIANGSSSKATSQGTSTSNIGHSKGGNTGASTAKSNNSKGGNGSGGNSKGAASLEAPIAATSSGGDVQLDDVHVALLAGRGVSVQCACGTRFCFRCGGPPHEPASCLQVEQFSERVRRAGCAGSEATEAYLSTKTRKCVKCQARTERTEGCNHMVCARCGAHWCWACGGDWAAHGRHTGGYYQCYLTMVRAAPSASQAINKEAMDALDAQVQRWAAHRRLCDQLHAIAGHIAWLQQLLSGIGNHPQPDVTGTASDGSDGTRLLQTATSEAGQQLLARWLLVACKASETMTWGHLLLMYTMPGSANWFYLKRKLESLQHSLQQLVQPLTSLPHAQHVLAGYRHPARRTMAHHPSHHPLSSLMDTMWHGAAALGSAGRTATHTGHPVRQTAVPPSPRHQAAGSARASTETADSSERLPWDDALHYELVALPPLYDTHIAAAAASRWSVPALPALGLLSRRLLGLTAQREHHAEVAAARQDGGPPAGCAADLLDQVPYVLVLLGAHADEVQHSIDEVVKMCSVLVRVARLGHMQPAGSAGQQGVTAEQLMQAPPLSVSTVVQATRGLGLLVLHSVGSLVGQLVTGGGREV